ncbi:MAG TPA: TonB-dependent receptor [Gammaproteobacteria bacterium]|nr:TonB-dependent receptor [Gammaproteobacteria bacterium]
MPDHRIPFLTPWLLPWASLSGMAVAAETAPVEPLAPLVVEASKQGHTLDEMPASVTVLEADTLDENRIHGLSRLSQRVPGLSFQPIGQSNLQPPVMRGLSAGPTSFSSSAVLLVDGVPTLSGFGFDDSLVGVEAVEVLRGPQSSLFGRNAQAGVINVVTRVPGDVLRADASLEMGERQRQALRLALDGPLVAGVLYGGVAGDFTRQDGYIDNTHTGSDENARERVSGRASVRWTPGESTDITLRVSRREYDDGGSDWGPLIGPRYTVASGTESFDRSAIDAVSLNVTHAITPTLTLEAVTADSRVRDRVRQDTDFMPADVVRLARDYTLDKLSQEIRLSGQWRGADWLAGVYADHDDNALRFSFKNPMREGTVQAAMDNRAVAAFSHWRVPLATHWSLSAGARVERTRAQIRSMLDGQREADWTRFSPTLALHHQASDHRSAYASLAQGYRAGGYNAFSPQANALFDAYAPEGVLSAEIGLRQQWPQYQASLAIALYYMDVDDMQVQQILADSGSAYITNAAKASSSGLEVEGSYGVAPGWRLQGSLAFNRTRFRDYTLGDANYDGNHNPFAPDVQGSLGLRYSHAQDWYLQASVLGSSRIYLDPANVNESPGYTLLNLVGGWFIGDAELGFYVNNATDREYDAVGFASGTTVLYSPPREAGIRLSYHY